MVRPAVSLRARSPAVEVLLRLCAVAFTLCVTRWFAPFEIGIAAFVVAVGAVCAETAGRAALRGLGPLVDERRSADVAPLLVALVLATALVALLIWLRRSIAELTGAYELANLLVFAAPLALLGAASVVLRRDRPASHLAPTTLVVAIAAFGACLVLARMGKTITALLAAAYVVQAAELCIALRGARWLPDLAAIVSGLRGLRVALLQVPISLGGAVVARADVFVVLAVLGPELAGAWFVARALTIDLGHAPAGIFPAARSALAASEPRRSPEATLMAWWSGAALLANSLVPDLLGPRWEPLATAIPPLAVAAILAGLATALRRAQPDGSVPLGPPVALALTASLAAGFGADALVFATAGVAALLASWQLGRAVAARAGDGWRALRPILAAGTITALAIAGARDLMAALGRPGVETLLLAASSAAVLQVFAVTGWAPFARHVAEDRAR